MKQILQFTLVMLILNSCSHAEQNDSVQDDNVSTFEARSLNHRLKSSSLPDPFDVSKIEEVEGLLFTAGGLSFEDRKEYCDDSDSGFYGRYHLVQPIYLASVCGSCSACPGLDPGSVPDFAVPLPSLHASRQTSLCLR